MFFERFTMYNHVYCLICYSPLNDRLGGLQITCSLLFGPFCTWEWDTRRTWFIVAVADFLVRTNTIDEMLSSKRITCSIQISVTVCRNDYYYCFTFQGSAKIPLALYASQLVLNWAWSPLFFEFHQLQWVRSVHI